MGIVQSVSSLARTLGPLIAGLFIEYVGIFTPFLASALLLIIASTIGYKTFHKKNNARIIPT
jgi:MFS family permease